MAPRNTLNRELSTPAKNKPCCTTPKIIAPNTFKWILFVGLVGLSVWFYSADFQMDSFGLAIDRDQAEETAKMALHDRGISLDESWRVQSTVEITGNEAKQYFKEKAGDMAYLGLMGSYLYPPLWKVNSQNLRVISQTGRKNFP